MTPATREKILFLEEFIKELGIPSDLDHREIDASDLDDLMNILAPEHEEFRTY